MKKEESNHKEYRNLVEETHELLILICVVEVVFILVSCVLLAPKRIVFVVVIASVIVSFVIFKKLNLKLKIKYKEEYFFKKLPSIFSNVKYNCTKGIERSQIGDTGMVGLGNIFDSSDFYSANYKNYNFVYSFIKNKILKTSIFGERKRITLFSSHWVIIDTDKKFETKVCIKAKSIYEKEQEYLKKYKTPYNIVETGNSIIDNCFITIVEDETKLDKVLTPSMIKKINKLLLISDQLIIIFMDNKIHVGIKPEIVGRDEVIALITKSDDDQAWDSINIIKNIIDIIIDNETVN